MSTIAPAAAAAAAKPTRVRAKEFQLSWVAKFGVQASTRDLTSGEVLVAKCLFCEHFGRDADAEEPSRKRKRTTNVQHFKQPWRGDNIASHMRKQHALRFAAYSALTLPEKARYFDGGGDDDGDGVEFAALDAEHLPAAAAGGGGADDTVPVSALETESEASKDDAMDEEIEGKTTPPRARANSQSGAAREDAAVGMSRLVDSGVSLSEARPQRRHRANHHSAATTAAAAAVPPASAAASVAVGPTSVTPAAGASLIAVAAGNDAGVQTLARALFMAPKKSVGGGSDERGGSFFQLVDKRVGVFVSGELLPPHYDQDSDRAQTLPAGFILQPEDEPDNLREGTGGVDFDTGRCLVRVADPQQFRQAVSFLVAGFSPDQCEELLRLSRGEDQMTAVAPSESRVLMHARHVCAMNYHAISELLRSVWAFSLVFDVSLAAGSDSRVVAVRVRCALEGTMHDVHLVTLSDTNEHVCAEAMLQRLTRAADAVCGDWQKKLVGIANDGSVSMSASLAAVVALLQQQHVAFPGCYAVWSGARQVESVVQHAFLNLCDDAFVSTMMRLAGYIRRRKDFAGGCPMFAGSQWMSMRDSLAWFVVNGAAVRRHLEEVRGEYEPEDTWWIALFSLHALVKEASACMLSMQGLTTHGAEQNRAIEKLLITLVANGYVDGPSRFQEEPNMCVLSGEYRVTYESAEMFVKKQGAVADTVMERVQQASPALHAKMLHKVAQMLADAVSNLAKLRSERARVTGLSDILPPVRPQDLAKTTTAFDLNRLVSLQRDRLKLSFGEQETKTIGAEFGELLAAYEREPSLKSALDSLPSNASFSASWRRVGDRFPSLCRFAGGLASVFRDPSAVGACDSSSSPSLVTAGSAPAVVSVALESMLHARQFHTLQRWSASRANSL